jgi:gliding motility-associated-like protein
MTKRLALFMIISCMAYIAGAQKQGNKWYFGTLADLDFNTSPPTASNSNVTNCVEGTSSIADPVTGQLLMYTNGLRVWDANHNMMPGAIVTPFRGHMSSTQSALIVPEPGSSSRYYIFTTAAQVSALYWPPAMYYNIVDMTLNGGNGDVVSWNNTLLDTTTEKLAAIGNCDGSEYWIVAHKWNCDSFYAFRLTSAGLSEPVKSKVGMVHHDPFGGFNTEASGYMKFSPDGKKLGLVVMGQIKTVEIFDFDMNTGIISNPITDPVDDLGTSTLDGPYGCSFSPDGSKFYVSIYTVDTTRNIWQYDLNAGSPEAIKSGKVNVAVQGDSAYSTGALQIGPDGKIYIALHNAPFLDIIHNPNEAGAACNYQPNGIALHPDSRSRLGLPNMVESFLAAPASVQFQPPLQNWLCPGDTAWAAQMPHHFRILPSAGVWVNGDSTWVAFSPDTTTTYWVISNNNCSPDDTISFTIHRSKGPDAAFRFSPEEIRPGDESFTLVNTTTGALHYHWYDFDGILFSNLEDPTRPHPGLGRFCYTLIASDSIACTDTAEQCIDVSEHGPLLIPNSFSPNNDGLNDVFRIHGLYRELLDFSIYNRYGERIYYTKNKSAGWDGTFKGKPCEQGTYYYIIRLVAGDGNTKHFKGDINLIR